MGLESVNSNPAVFFFLIVERICLGDIFVGVGDELVGNDGDEVFLFDVSRNPADEALK